MPDPKTAPAVKLGAPVQAPNAAGTNAPAPAAPSRPRPAGAPAPRTPVQDTGPASAGAAIDNQVSELFDAPAPDRTPAPAPAPTAKPVEPAAPRGQPAPETPGIPNDVIPVEEAPPAPETPVGSEEEHEAEGPPPGSDPKANHAWAEGKRQRRELRDKVKALEQELARMRETPLPEQQEVQQLRQQVSEYEARLGQFDLASTRAFKNKFDAPLDALLQRGVSLLVRSGRDPEAARELMDSLVESARSGELDMDAVNQKLSDQNFAVQGALLTTITDFADMAKARAEALKTWKDTKAALTVQETRDQEVSLTEHIERDTGIALTQVLKEGNWMFARSKENQAWNEGVDQRLAAVRGIVRTAKTGELIKWVMEGVTAKATREFAQKLRAENLKLKEELGRLVQVTPRVGAAGDAATRRAAPAAGPRDPGQVIDETFAGDSRRMR